MGAPFYVEIYKGRSKRRSERLRWRAIDARNGLQLAKSSEGYANAEDRLAAIEVLFGREVEIREAAG